MKLVSDKVVNFVLKLIAITVVKLVGCEVAGITV